MRPSPASCRERRVQQRTGPVSWLPRHPLPAPSHPHIEAVAVCRVRRRSQLRVSDGFPPSSHTPGPYEYHPNRSRLSVLRQGSVSLNDRRLEHLHRCGEIVFIEDFQRNDTGICACQQRIDDREERGYRHVR